jgi:Fe-S-cluster containining protein
MMANLLIPNGINFECTKCGHCCLNWPVPIAQSEVAGLKALEKALVPNNIEESLRSIPAGFDANSEFTHYLNKQESGRCEFLDEQDSCAIHTKYGAAQKPLMCSLFPYTFNQTPGGIFASVSFASTGVLQNAGRPLSEQKAVLEEKWELFQRLFPNKIEWSHLQLIDGVLMNWRDFAEFDRDFIMPLASAQDSTMPTAEDKLLRISEMIVTVLPDSIDPERAPPMEAPPENVDLALLSFLSDFYLPDNLYKRSDRDLNVVLSASLEPEIEDLLDRFVYCKLFSKLFFGPGYANFSLLVGVHHLLAVISLMRLAMKASIVKKKIDLDFAAVCELVRSVEIRMTDARFSKETTAVLEVLLSSPKRARRIAALAKLRHAA